MSSNDTLSSYYQRSFYTQTNNITFNVPSFTPLLIPIFHVTPLTSPIPSCDDTVEDSSTDTLNIHEIDDFEKTCQIINKVIKFTKPEEDNSYKLQSQSEIKEKINETSSGSYVTPYTAQNDSTLEELEKEIHSDLIKKWDRKEKKRFNPKKSSSQYLFESLDKRKTMMKKRRKNYKREEHNQWIIDTLKILIGLAIILLCCGLIWKSHTEMIIM
ncbi:hypothetical protein EDI_002810 [Entamoeba dispar SAW760]|uniref:Uncharacterized protein n=1 Tax=Entamoeba dispar (strain ATCC PRA-260 / SAW760) TaxID=370354 RepID=B0EJA9_ENTDS|nr:uncharacterized protein EDI_002810 [Entamoeba dispar SAW760]EDR25417.1 hypothetical protein EDI_002810 [Entamoeba dispar SAW760]|eukprot:EDR25417.1 hypothetical protein EDI_002810 [Entamoeba dispar SAW760]